MRIGHCAYLTLCEYGVLERRYLNAQLRKLLIRASVLCVKGRYFTNYSRTGRPSSDKPQITICTVEPARLGHALLHIGRAVVLWLPSGKF
jgi:hypothetical protein